MAKNDDIDRIQRELDDLDAWKQQQEKEAAYKRGMLKVIVAVCVTATSAMIGAANYIGAVIYHKWDALKAAIDAYNKASGGGQ